MAMRVLHVQRAKGVSGSERHLLSLLPASAPRASRPVCVCSRPARDSASSAELEAAGVDVTVRERVAAT